MTPVASNTSRSGLLLCLASAAGFGSMPVLAKVVYQAGGSVTTMLAVRFVLAAAALWLIVAVTGAAPLPRRTTFVALGLGAVGYTLESALFFAGLQHMDASLASLIFYVYPALVTVLAVLLGREQVTQRRIVALTLACSGAVLVLLGGGSSGSIALVGVLLLLTSAGCYAGYILIADGVAHGDPLRISALITTGAAVTFCIATLISGGPDFPVTAGGWLAIGGITLFGTVLAIGLFLVGLRRVGPASASIASTFEPVVTVVLAIAFLGDRLATAQLAGGALVVAAVVLLQLPTGRVSLRGPAALAARRPADRALARRAS